MSTPARSDRTLSIEDHRYRSFTMILPVFNEQARIRRVVEYYRHFAPLIVVDNYSSDNTTGILEELRVHYVRYKNPGTTQTPECMRFFATLSKTDYVLFLACSEFLPPPLLERFDEVARSRSHDVVSCVRDSYTCGENIPLWKRPFRNAEVRTERFMNIRALDMNSVVIHGSFQPADPTRTLLLPGDKDFRIVHLRDSDATSLIGKSGDYASVEARHRFERGKQISGLRLFLLLIQEMVKFFLLPLSKWNKIALREVWARMVMHSIIYWIGWELKEGRSLDYSRQKSEELWMRLVSQNKQGDRKDR